MKLYWCVLVYFIASVSYILLCKALLKQDSFPWFMVLAYAVFITPVISYVSARMIGLTGSPLAFPFLREGSIILSGYKGVDIWYAPLPLADYGVSAQMFRELTLTRTKFSSLVKIELFMLPLALICSLLFWAFFWHIEAIPSATYPFTAKMWPLQATYQCLFMTATLGEFEEQEGQAGQRSDNKPENLSLFQKDTQSQNLDENGKPFRKNFLAQAIKPKLILLGFIIGFALRLLTNVFGFSHFFFYGMIGGLGAIPNAIIPMFAGAIIGRRFLAKKFGQETWRKYTPVLAAGYACGVGLIGMLAVAFAMIAKTISSLPY